MTEGLRNGLLSEVLCPLLPQVLALTEIQGVKGSRARLLYKAGLRTPEAVAATDVDRCGIRLVQLPQSSCSVLLLNAAQIANNPDCGGINVLAQ